MTSGRRGHFRPLAPVQVVSIRPVRKSFEVTVYDGKMQRVRYMAMKSSHEDVLSAYARIDKFLYTYGFVRECNND